MAIKEDDAFAFIIPADKEKIKQFWEENSEKLKIFQDILSKNGMKFEWSEDINGFLVILNQTTYNNIRTRKAGRKQLFIRYRYSDIISMQQTMSEKKIYETLNISPSTYFRRKKKMLESDYYATLDKSLINDKDYLESHIGNELF